MVLYTPPTSLQPGDAALLMKLTHQDNLAGVLPFANLLAEGSKVAEAAIREVSTMVYTKPRMLLRQVILDAGVQRVRWSLNRGEVNAVVHQEAVEPVDGWLSNRTIVMDPKSRRIFDERFSDVAGRLAHTFEVLKEQNVKRAVTLQARVRGTSQVQGLYFRDWDDIQELQLLDVDLNRYGPVADATIEGDDLGRLRDEVLVAFQKKSSKAEALIRVAADAGGWKLTFPNGATLNLPGQGVKAHAEVHAANLMPVLAALAGLGGVQRLTLSLDPAGMLEVAAESSLLRHRVFLPLLIADGKAAARNPRLLVPMTA